MRRVPKVAIGTLIVVGLLIWRIISVWPDALPKMGLFSEAERRGASYSFRTLDEIGLDRVVRRERLPLQEPLDFEARRFVLESTAGQYHKVSESHHYSEFMLPGCRVREHTALLSGEGIDTWVEFLPNSLSIDDLFAAWPASSLDAERREYVVYLSCPMDRIHHKIEVRDRMVKSVQWSRLPRGR